MVYVQPHQVSLEWLPLWKQSTSQSIMHFPILVLASNVASLETILPFHTEFTDVDAILCGYSSFGQNNSGPPSGGYKPVTSSSFSLLNLF